MGCGADPGVKIYIQKPNDDYCSVPLPMFDGGETKTLTRGNLTGDCKSVYFEVGRESINFWIYSKEFACVNSLTLRFSTPKGQVTFLAKAASGHYYVYGTTSNGIINSVKKQSRKFKIFLCRNKNVKTVRKKTLKIFTPMFYRIEYLIFFKIFLGILLLHIYVENNLYL